MKRDSTNRRNERRNYLLKRPAAAVLSLGMILPEYLLLAAVGAILALTILAIVPTIIGLRHGSIRPA
jgi:hypothetical protein